jgi:hypothetical protein
MVYQEDTLAEDLTAAATLDGTEKVLMTQSDLLVDASIATIWAYLKSLGQIPKRVATTATGAAHAPNVSTTDIYKILNLNVNASIDPPTGSPSDGQILEFIITGDPTPRNLTFNAIYRFSTSLAAPATTTASKTMYLKFQYNLVATKYDCILKIDNY